MATTTRSKYRQMIKEVEVEEENLVQEITKKITEESESDSDYDNEADNQSENSHVTVQEISDNTISDISDIIIVEDAEINKKSSSKKERKPPTKITKPKTSWVWAFFKTNEDNSKTICQIEGCGKMLTWCGSPSSMKIHLSGTHNITKAIAMKHMEGKLTNLSQQTNDIKPHHSSKQESLTKNVIGFVVGTVQPLSIVEDPDFINMINGFDQRYRIPCTKTLKDRISTIYEAGKDALKDQLKEVQHISLTLDAWSSPAHLPYLGITAHWVTSKFEPHEVLLNMSELPYPHGANEIQEHLFDLLYEWKIDLKINAIVTDNASNVKKACNNLGIGERIPCTAHTLQLSIGKGLEVIKALIDKCKHLITFLSTDKKKQQLRESQIYLYRQQAMQLQIQNEELDEDKNPICLDVIKANNTRWNSTLYALQRLVTLKSAISMLKVSLMNDTNSYIRKEGERLEELYPTAYEWKEIKETVELLNPFENATRFLSGVKYPTIGFAYPCMCSLQERLESEFDLLETDNVKNCRDAILEDLARRWEFPQELCLKGSFFDPRFKNLDFINSQEKISDIVNQLRAEFENFKQSNISEISDKSVDDLTTAMGNFWKKKNAKTTMPIKDEFQHYLNVVELPALEEYDPFVWWLTNKSQYPVLHNLAMKYLSIPATSVPSERLFSDAKNLITPQRTRLDSFFIDQLMFLKRNREYVDIYVEEAELDKIL